MIESTKVCGDGNQLKAISVSSCAEILIVTLNRTFKSPGQTKGKM